MKFAIGDELQTRFHPIVHVSKQAAEDTRKELAPMEKTLTDIDGALAAQHVDARHHRVKLLILSLVSTRKMGNYVWEIKQYNSI